MGYIETSAQISATCPKSSVLPIPICRSHLSKSSDSWPAPAVSSLNGLVRSLYRSDPPESARCPKVVWSFLLSQKLSATRSHKRITSNHETTRNHKEPLSTIHRSCLCIIFRTQWLKIPLMSTSLLENIHPHYLTPSTIYII